MPFFESASGADPEEYVPELKQKMDSLLLHCKTISETGEYNKL